MRQYFIEMVPVIGIEDMASRAHFCCSLDYLISEKCRVINLTAMDELMSFPTQIHEIML